MIYSDKLAHGDREYMPERRDDDVCLNCKNDYYDHKGWNCNSKSSVGEFGKISDGMRYLTQSMKDSLGHTPKLSKTHIVTVVDITVGMKLVYMGANKREPCEIIKVGPTLVDFTIISANGRHVPYTWKIHTLVNEINQGHFIIDSSQAITIVPAPIPKTVDLTDWRMWAPKRESHECPCGIHKAQCSYHK